MMGRAATGWSENQGWGKRLWLPLPAASSGAAGDLRHGGGGDHPLCGKYNSVGFFLFLPAPLPKHGLRKTWSFLSEIVSGGHAVVDPRGTRRQPAGLGTFSDGDAGWKADLLLFRMSAVPPVPAIISCWRIRFPRTAAVHGGEEKIDAAFPGGRLRPGNARSGSVAPGPLHLWLYEMVNQDKIPVYFRISDSSRGSRAIATL